MTASSTLDTATTEPAAPRVRGRTTPRRGVFAALSDRIRDEAAADRILRRLGSTFGLAGVIAGVVEIPEIVEQSRFADPGGSVALAVLAFGLFPVVVLVSIGLSRRVIQIVAGGAALCYLVATALAPLVYHDLPAHTTSLWLYRVFALGMLAAALAWRPPLAITYLVAGSVLAAVANRAALPTPTGGTWSMLGDIARAAGLCALFLWCAIYARAAAERVDREFAIAGSRAATVAGAAARDRERTRFAALIHDAVLSTLLDASRAGTESPVLRRQAERTLIQLDEARGSRSGPDRLDAKSAIGFLRGAVHEVNPGIEFTARRWNGFDDLRMPVHAAGSLAAALTEAVRNSLRHAPVAGRTVRRCVTVTVSAGGIRVVFRDDGAGFDLDRVPADRLGVSVSILGRMRQLAGGAGFVESTPGEGTTVTLVWGSDG